MNNQRMNRNNFLKIILWCCLTLLVSAIALTFMTGVIKAIHADFLGWIAVFVVFGIWINLLIVSMNATVKRLHDANLSGWFAIFALFFYIATFIIAVLPGTDGVNQYGEPSNDKISFCNVFFWR